MKTTLKNIFSNTFSRILILGSFFLILFQNTAFAAESVDCDIVFEKCVEAGLGPIICIIVYYICQLLT